MKKYQVTLAGKEIIFRELTLGEWGSLSNYMNSYFALYDIVCRMGIVSPFYEALSSGEAIWIGEQIFFQSMKFSDDTEINNGVEKILKNIEESVHVLPAIICSAFPAYKPEDIMNFDFETLTTRLAQISWMENRETRVPTNAALPPQARSKSMFNEGDLRQMSIEKSKEALKQAISGGKKNEVHARAN